MDRPKQGFCRPARLPFALLPIANRADVNLKNGRELSLAQLSDGTNLSHIPCG